MANEKSKEKAPGRYKPTYKPSGKGSYNARWRKEERREAAIARQKALCEANAADHTKGLVKRIKQDDDGHYIQVKVPLDWKMMLPKGERDV